MSAVLDRTEAIADEVERRKPVIAHRIANSAAERACVRIEWDQITVSTYIGTLGYWAALQEAAACHASGHKDIAGDILNAVQSGLTDWLESSDIVQIEAEYEVQREIDAAQALDAFDDQWATSRGDRL